MRFPVLFVTFVGGYLLGYQAAWKEIEDRPTISQWMETLQRPKGSA